MTRRTLFVAFVAASAGCSGTSSQEASGTAQGLLSKTLETWKSGKAVSELASKSPAVKVSDYRWESGFKLTKFEIAQKPANTGFDVRFPVELWLTPPKGKPIREKAFYTIVTSPTITVFRDPES